MDPDRKPNAVPVLANPSGLQDESASPLGPVTLSRSAIRPALLIVGLLIVVTAVVATVAVRFSSSGGTTGTFPPPVPGVASATRDYLVGAGSPLLVLDKVSQPLQHPPGAGLATVCGSVVTSLVNQVGSAKLANLAAQVPDPILSQLLFGEETAVINGLVACGKNDVPGARADFVLAGRSASLVHRRLRELGS